MEITLYGDPRTKKNSMRAVGIRGRGVRLLPSKAFAVYETDCLKQITGDMKLAINQPVNVRCVYYMRTRRRVDLSNLIEATHDILVKAGVLADDNSNIVASVDGSRVMYDRENPRVEITITGVDTA